MGVIPSGLTSAKRVERQSSKYCNSIFKKFCIYIFSGALRPSMLKPFSIIIFVLPDLRVSGRRECRFKDCGVWGGGGGVQN